VLLPSERLSSVGTAYAIGNSVGRFLPFACVE
jgi:hypothetical protein